MVPHRQRRRPRGGRHRPTAAGGVVAEELAVADVLAHHPLAAVPGLGHDAPLAGPGHGGGRGQSGAQAVAGVARRVEPGRRGRALDHQGHGLVGQAPGLQLLVPVDAAEQGAGGEAGGVEPLLHRPHRAGGGVGAVGHAELAPRPLLVGLAAAQRDDQPGAARLQVGDVEPHELAAPEGAGEAQQQERAVAQAQQGGRQRGHHGPHVGRERRRLARLCRALRPADAGPDGAHRGVPRRRLVGRRPGQLVRLRDGGEAALQRAGRAPVRQVGQVEGHGLGRRPGGRRRPRAAHQAVKSRQSAR